MKISTKQFKTHSLLTEQLFADEVQIGVMTRPLSSPSAPIRASYIKNGCKIELGMFSGNFGRRDAKTAIIDRHKKGI